MDGKEKIDFGNEVAKILPSIIRSVTQGQSSILTEGNLSIPQMIILELLREKGPCKMNELAKALHLTMSAVTAIIDKMIKHDLVKRERSDEDRRVVNVILMKKGEETAKRIGEERRKTANQIFSPLSGSERKEYLRLLRKVYVNLHVQP